MLCLLVDIIPLNRFQSAYSRGVLRFFRIDYLNYRNEIKYYSGLHGEDENLIIHFNNILSRYKEYFHDIEKNTGAAIYFPDIDIEDNTKISVEQITQESHDKILESKSTNIRKQNNAKTILKDEENSHTLDKKLFQTNILLSNIIRNSEQLRNPDLKVKTLYLVTNNLSKFFQKQLNKTQGTEKSLLEFIQTEKNIENFTKEDIREFTSLLNSQP